MMEVMKTSESEFMEGYSAEDYLDDCDYDCENCEIRKECEYAE